MLRAFIEFLLGGPTTTVVWVVEGKLRVQVIGFVGINHTQTFSARESWYDNPIKGKSVVVSTARILLHRTSI